MVSYELEQQNVPTNLSLSFTPMELIQHLLFIHYPHRAIKFLRCSILSFKTSCEI